jgi:hypothetical protein
MYGSTDCCIINISNDLCLTSLPQEIKDIVMSFLPNAKDIEEAFRQEESLRVPDQSLFTRGGFAIILFSYCLYVVVFVLSHAFTQTFYEVISILGITFISLIICSNFIDWIHFYCRRRAIVNSTYGMPSFASVFWNKSKRNYHCYIKETFLSR